MKRYVVDTASQIRTGTTLVVRTHPVTHGNKCVGSGRRTRRRRGPSSYRRRRYREVTTGRARHCGQSYLRKRSGRHRSRSVGATIDSATEYRSSDPDTRCTRASSRQPLVGGGHQGWSVGTGTTCPVSKSTWTRGRGRYGTCDCSTGDTRYGTSRAESWVSRCRRRYSSSSSGSPSGPRLR